MNRHRIVNARADATLLQRLQHLVTVRHGKRIDMIDVSAVCGRARPRKRKSREGVIILCRRRPASLGPRLDVVHLDVEDCSLNPIHPEIVAGNHVIVLGLLSPIPQQRNLAGELWPVRDYCSSLAIGSQVLAWIKAETAEVSDRARATALVLRPMCL